MKYLNKLIFIFYLLIFCSDFSWAETFWLCSRSTEAVQADVFGLNSDGGNFNIAEFGNANNVIGISIRDLIDVYSGRSVRIAGGYLAACYFSGNNKSSEEALKSLGLNSNVIKSLTRRSAIVQSPLFEVTNDDEMLSCIDKHSPAVGYLDRLKENTNVASCF